ncbi:MAG: GNAT family N-acetyltransferase [Clostridia bacterium]|nr:GNAT family N-acetyltransferase [Clostridia bacterium]
MFSVEKIETERLVLRELEMNDLEDYFEWKRQEEYYNFLPSKPMTKEECLSSLSEIIEKYEQEKEQKLIWGIALKGSNKLIGSLHLGKISSTHKCCEIGWGLNPKFQKQGYAIEAAKSFVDYIFNKFGMHKIGVLVWEGNLASQTLVKKLGFCEEGRERQARFKNGKYIDVLHFGLLEDEWQG